jgi:hypothetical protein
MSCPALPHLRIVPGTLLVLFVVHIDSASTTLATSASRFLEGLKASCDLMGFGAVQREDDRLDELLPWAGNV